MAKGPDGKFQPTSEDSFKLANLVRETRKAEESSAHSAKMLEGQGDSVTENLVRAILGALVPMEKFTQAHQEQTNLALGLLRHLRTEMELTTPELRASATIGGLNLFLQTCIKVADNPMAFKQFHHILETANAKLGVAIQTWMLEEIKAGRDPLDGLK